IVKLNVGGQSFHTSRSKLVETSAYFRNLLEGDMKETSTIDDEEIFIDRCGMLFEYLLQYLRTGYIGGGNNVRLQDLQQEALYYQLDTLVEVLD
ncbi:BTB/POZ protein, partial [Mucor mucedo]|uniref:BTB/POZ protein n=1 Tax=Mucor mucedo TaxID=29922 RepID=UPI002220DB02